MLQSKAKWKILDETNEENRDLSTKNIVNNILIQKGIVTAKDQDKFLHPSLDFIQSPENFEQIKKAKERIDQAITRDEKIVVYGDYDADGITATTVLIEGLRELGASCDYYIPNRFTEGYGLNEQVIRQFASEGISLLITVDTGIANVDEVTFAQELGIDVIITDHHEVQEELPPAYAIIHPHLSTNYHFKSLAGVGVAFQFVRFLLNRFPKEWLDLVAIGTIADLVPLVDENRTLVHFGLQQMVRTNRLGLQLLIESSQIEKEITSVDISFRIAPRMNAVGRLENADLVVHLLLTNDVEEARSIITKIETLNNERKKIVEDIVQAAIKRVDEKEAFIMLADESWNEGVLGIAASQLVKKYERPVLLLTKGHKEGTWKGSARSIPNFNLFENGIKIRDWFTSFGGHSQAAGVTFPVEHFEQIKDYFITACEEQIPNMDLKQELIVNQKLDVAHLTEQLVDEINLLAPYGEGNEEPLFLLEAVPTQVRQIGQHQAHLKIQFQSENGLVEAIGFGFGHVAPFISGHSTVSIVGSLSINEWNGHRTVQLIMKDIAVNEWQLFDYRGKQRIVNIEPFLIEESRHVLICNEKTNVAPYASFEQLHIASYDDDPLTLPKAHILFIYDLPDQLDRLTEVIQATNPNSIHVSYHVQDSAFLFAIPNRDQFKWLYGYIKKYEPIYLQIDLPKIIQLTKMSKEAIIFMIKVFHDLQFIHVKQNVLTINDDAPKANLEQSITYQNYVEKKKIEQILYYSTYNELKEWFKQHAVNTIEEEKFHGLETTY